MNKLKLSKKSKNGFISLCVIGIVIFIGWGYKALTLQRSYTEEKAYYEYTINPQVNYEVRLQQNPIYTETIQEEGKMYVSAFVRDIKSLFHIQVQVSEVSTINIAYEVAAEVANYIIEDKVKKDIWCKTYTLVPLKSYKEEGVSMEVDAQGYLDYNAYNAFVQSVNEATQTNGQYEIRGKLIGRVQIDTSTERVEEPITLAVNVPLDTTYFPVIKEGEEKIQNTLTKVEIRNVPINSKVLVGCGIAIVVLVGGIVFLAWGTTIPTQVDMKRKAVKKLLKDYGSRMVGVEVIDITPYSVSYVMTDIQDFIKLADEMGLPIFYARREDVVEIDRFYSMKDAIIYICRLE